MEHIWDIGDYFLIVLIGLLFVQAMNNAHQCLDYCIFQLLRIVKVDLSYLDSSCAAHNDDIQEFFQIFSGLDLANQEHLSQENKDVKFELFIENGVL